MIGIRNMGRLGMRALLVAFVAATISCGGPGSAGVPNQDLDTADDFFAGRFSGRVQVNVFQLATWTFTGSTIDTVDGGIIAITTNNEPPEGVLPPLEANENDLAGSFDSNNASFELFGIVQTAADDVAMIESVDLGISIVGQASGNFTNDVPVPNSPPGVTPGQFTMVIETIGTFTGEVIRGTFEE